MKPLLLDTGPVVALLDRDDARHEFVKKRLARLQRSGPLLTTGAVVTEVMYLLQDIPEGPEKAATFFQQEHVDVIDVFSPAQLRFAAGLMERYRDTPMDFADATLVLVAGTHGTGNILTLDERGFHTFRFLKNRSFRLLLQEADARP